MIQNSHEQLNKYNSAWEQRQDDGSPHMDDSSRVCQKKVIVLAFIYSPCSDSQEVVLVEISKIIRINSDHLYRRNGD